MTLGHKLALTALLMSFILIGLMGFWLIYPYKILSFEDAVYPVINKEVRAGDTLRFVSNYCKSNNLSSETSRAFVDDVISYVPITTSNVPTGCNKITISVPIPPSLPPGKYYLQNFYKYRANPIRTIVEEHNTEGFEIVK